jgi:hypothetical protein
MLSKLLCVSSFLLAYSVAEPTKLLSIPADEFVGLTDVKFSPGVTASMEVDVMQEAANVWFDTIIQVVNGLKIPDFDMGSGDYMNDNTFYIKQRVANVELYSTSNNALHLNCKQLTASFKSNHFRYKVAPLIKAKGYVEVDMEKVDIGFGL